MKIMYLEPNEVSYLIFVIKGDLEVIEKEPKENKSEIEIAKSLLKRLDEEAN